MRLSLAHVMLVLSLLALAATGVAATFTPATTPPTVAISPSPVASPEGSPPIAPSSTLSAPSAPVTPRRTPRPTASAATEEAAAPTPVAAPDSTEDAEAPAPEMTAAFAIPTGVPAAAARAFRTPEREAPPPFVAPQIELPEEDVGAPGAAEPEPMPSPDQPYIATVTFRATATTDIDGFELFIIYPRSAGDFVGSRNGVDCRKTGDGTMFADDTDDGTLRLLVGSNRPLVFPLDIVCRFTVEPNAVLTSRLIAVNVAEATIAGARAESSALTVAVTAH